MNEKIKEVLNAVDCVYEPKMLIELIRWQQQRIAHLENALSGSPDLTTNGGRP